MNPNLHILLTPSEMYRADQWAISQGNTGVELMENAGARVVEVVCRHYQQCPVVVLCGPGNNGGDGFVVARLLRELGWPVRLALVGELTQLTGDAAIMAKLWMGEVEPATPEFILEGKLIIDALLGAGLSRNISDSLAHLINAINQSLIPVIAIDIPSGIDGSDGNIRGVAVKANHTVTFFRKKPGHLLLPGRLHCGTLSVMDIAIEDGALAQFEVAGCSENHPDLWRDDFPHRRMEGHKYHYGHAVVISGGPWTTGAARLAALAALRVGAGLVTIASPKDAMAINAAHLTAIMLECADDPAQFKKILQDKRKNAVLIGPAAGISDETRGKTLVALASDVACVVDADALSSFNTQPQMLFDAIKADTSRPVILTPHDGEFAGLFSDIAANESNKIARARSAAEKSGAIIILKGSDSVIADPDGRSVINTNAPPDLATAGSGDVLAGIVVGLLAGYMPGFAAACAGVYMHGAAGQVAGRGLIAEDLPAQLPRVLPILE